MVDANDVDVYEACEVDRVFPRVASMAMIMWLSLLAMVSFLAPRECFEELQGLEQQVPAAASTVLFASLGMYCIPFLGILSNGSRRKRPSGIIFAAMMVVVCAIVTNLLLAFFPTPVVVDPITGARVFLVRWCEWTPLSGLLTFLSDAVDVPKPTPSAISKTQKSTTGGFRRASKHSILQTLSTFCGLILPFCGNRAVWWAVLVFSCITYLPIFGRVQEKHRKLTETSKSVTMAELEMRDRRHFAHQLLRMCAIVWTVLVAFYFLNWFLHQSLSEKQPPLWHSAYAMLFDTTFDVLAKGFYLKVIVEVHHNVFDAESRIHHQFDELRSLITVIWDTSTEVIFISVKGKNKKGSTLISPSFPSFVGCLPPNQTTRMRTENSFGVMVETETEHVVGEDRMKATTANYVDSNHLASTHGSLQVAPIDLQSRLVEVATDIINALWDRLANNLKEKASVLLLHEFTRPDGQACYCEITVSQRSPESLVAIVRDVTERHRRFNAEQKAHEEAMARQQDAQAVNRFTRNEIKNGLLSGLELCRRLKVSCEQVGTRLDNYLVDMPAPESRLVESGMAKTTGIIGKVDGVFHNLLDTVLSEAMTRDVVHECYQPLVKKVDVAAVLRACHVGVGMDERFALHMPNGAIPPLMLDETMLRFIHRNAVSNAVKYGRPNGQITTRLTFDENTWLLNLQVENEPGAGHERLVSMGDKASEMVFQQGSRLHFESGPNDVSNGAWVMQKCALNMRGTCTIRFESQRTVFSLECPASPCLETNLLEEAPTRLEKLPASTWGLGIDDSVVQRKFLLRIMSECGIQKERRKVIGQNAAEAGKTRDTILSMLNEDQSSRVLVLIDENLDFVLDGGGRLSISGSLAMERVLNSLPPSQQDRLLVLVRSADDSLNDVAVYAKRTHGFLPKSVTTRDKLMEHLRPLWDGRFGPSDSPPVSLDSSERSRVSALLTREDLGAMLSAVDELLSQAEMHQVPWESLRSALHPIQEDIMLSENEHLIWASNAIRDLMGQQAPDDFAKRWSDIREAIMCAMDDFLRP